MTGRRAWVVVGVIVVAAAAGYAATYALYPAPRQRGEVTVPALRGATREDALAQLDALGLRGRDGGTIADPLTPSGTVSWQSTPAETRVPVGSVVRLGVSTGAPVVEVPDVTDFDLALGRDVLEAAGLTVGGVDSVRSREPAGAILQTRPAVRTAVRAGTEMQVTVSRGPTSAPTRRP